MPEARRVGAALQALWCLRLQKGDRVNLGDLTDQFVTLNHARNRNAEAGRRDRLSRVAGIAG